MCDIICLEESKEEKVYKILNVINQLLDEMQITILGENFGIISSEEIKSILEKNGISIDKDIEKKIIKKNKSITIEEFNEAKDYYNILYNDYFLPKVYSFTTKTTVLFKTINEAYYYKKFIKYMTNFLKKYPEYLNDDIIKGKIYEIISCLDSDDKLYTYDFYFYISMMHIEKDFQKIDIQKQEFEPLNLTNTKNVLQVFSDIYLEKNELIDFINRLPIIKNPNSKLINYIKDIDKDVTNLFIAQKIENIKKDDNDFKLELISKSEKEFIIYIQDNKSNEEIIQLMKDLEVVPEMNNIFEFYYKGKINDFLSLSKEHIYLIIHSYHTEKKTKNFKFSQHVSNYIDQLNSYNEGVKHDLKKEIKEIIENAQFFTLIKDIYNSETIKEYCQNPIQYFKPIKSTDVKIYYEKDEEMKKKRKKVLEEIEKKVTKFTTDNNIKNNEGNNEYKNEDNVENFETKGLPDILECEFIDPKNLKEIDEKEEDCQLYMDYNYFMKNIFNENFFKERIIYSFLPVSIKAFVSNIPKIVLNISGNSILTYKIDKNSNNFKKILTALLVCIIIHEMIHMCRRENKNKILENDNYTPNEKDQIYEGGKSLIFHIFGVFIINYINLDFAETILNKESWNNNGKLLKEKYSELGKDEKAKKEYVELNGGIKCYNSEELEEKYNIEEDDFYYYYCC